MRHLFIINPVANKIKGKTSLIIEHIRTFFADFPQLNYDLHVTRWARDALGFARRYALSSPKERVRVHTFGGTGTLFEIVNGVVDLANVDISAYPMGRDNNLLHYFGDDNMCLFSSIEKQVFCRTANIDAIRCGHNYGICNASIGFEADVIRQADKVLDKMHIKPDYCYIMLALTNALKGTNSQIYKMELDGRSLDGNYMSLSFSNEPWFTNSIGPFVEARINDGVFDVYTVNNMNRREFISFIPAYISGNYTKFPDKCTHYTGRKAKISSDSVMCLSIDGEPFYSNSVELEIIPGAIKLVCPDGIDIDASIGFEEHTRKEA